MKINWPGGKQFAFTILDDPDWDNLENAARIYAFLSDLGLRTTKGVWPLQGKGTPKVGGATCGDEEYLKLVLALKEQGFEIALHNVAPTTSSRDQTIQGLDTFRRLFGHDPYTFTNHTGCDESIYWGRQRLSGIHRTIYDLLHAGMNENSPEFQGHIENSPLFWGDLCRDRIRYVRNFVFGDINTLKVCPMMPYHDSNRAFVNYWFAASEGATIDSFNATISEANQDKLASEGGACIVYTHFAKGFIEKGNMSWRFKMLMERLSAMNGWFVPVSTLLDFILQARGHHVITRAERSALERQWLWHKIVHTYGRT